MFLRTILLLSALLFLAEARPQTPLKSGNTGAPYDYSFGGVGFDITGTYSSNGCAWNFELNQQNKCVPKSSLDHAIDKFYLAAPYLSQGKVKSNLGFEIRTNRDRPPLYD